MFKDKRSSIKPEAAAKPNVRTEVMTEVFISKSTVITGTILTDDHIRIEGRVKGDITARGNIALGQQAMIEGNIKGANVAISGRLQGNVSAAGELRLQSGARVMGDVTAYSVIIEEGASFKGQSVISKNVEKPQPDIEKRPPKPVVAPEEDKA